MLNIILNDVINPALDIEIFGGNEKNHLLCNVFFMVLDLRLTMKMRVSQKGTFFF